MNFEEAMHYLNAGKKIRRAGWEPDVHLCLCESIDEDANTINVIRGFRREAVPFDLTMSIFNSEGWQVLDVEGEFKFYEIISRLKQGYKARLVAWLDGIWIEKDTHKSLMQKRWAEYNFTPSFQCIQDTDWEIFRE
jgi:hypothetical protein